MILLNIGDLFTPAHIRAARARARFRIRDLFRPISLDKPQVAATPKAPIPHLDGGRGFRRHPSFRAIVLAVIDVQLIALVAYGWHFHWTGICQATTYHFYVYVNMALMGLANTVLAALVLPNY